MPKSRNIVPAAALIGLSLMVAGLAPVPFSDAREFDGSVDDGITQRLSDGYLGLPEPAADTAIEAAAAQAAKGDFLERPGCFGQVWPDISPDCLAKVGSTPRLAARTVTIGYRIGEASSVLIRMPAPEVAER